MIKHVSDQSVGVTPDGSNLRTGSPVHPISMRCNICDKQMTDCDGMDPLAWDCGGDCVECMASCGDPDCQRTVNMLRPGTYEIEGVSPLNTIQELVDRDEFYPWRVLVVCALLNMTHGRGVRPMIEPFFRRVRDPQTMAGGHDGSLFATLEPLLAPLGFKNRRYTTLYRMSEDYLGLEPYEKMYGVGQYALDSVRLFVQGWTGELLSNDTWLKPYCEWRRAGGPAVNWDQHGYNLWHSKRQAEIWEQR